MSEIKIPTKYKDFASLESFVFTINYLEDKVATSGHKARNNERIQKLKSMALSYMNDLQNNQRQTSLEDIQKFGPEFLQKFGPDKDSQNYSNVAIRFRSWMDKKIIQASTPSAEASNTNTAPKTKAKTKSKSSNSAVLDFFSNFKMGDIAGLSISAGLLAGGVHAFGLGAASASAVVGTIAIGTAAGAAALATASVAAHGIKWIKQKIAASKEKQVAKQLVAQQTKQTTQTKAKTKSKSSNSAVLDFFSNFKMGDIAGLSISAGLLAGGVHAFGLGAASASAVVGTIAIGTAAGAAALATASVAAHGIKWVKQKIAAYKEKRATNQQTQPVLQADDIYQRPASVEEHLDYAREILAKQNPKNHDKQEIYTLARDNNTSRTSATPIVVPQRVKD